KLVLHLALDGRPLALQGGEAARGGAHLGRVDEEQDHDPDDDKLAEADGVDQGESSVGWECGAGGGRRERGDGRKRGNTKPFAGIPGLLVFRPRLPTPASRLTKC